MDIRYGLVILDKKTKRSNTEFYESYEEAFSAMKEKYEKNIDKCGHGELNDNDAWLGDIYKRYKMAIVDLKEN